MERLRHSRPSPALVVAVLALVAALAGSAVAEVATTTKLNKKEKKQTRTIANKQINKKALGLSVAEAQNAQNAQNAESANTANSANSVAAGAIDPRALANNAVTSGKLATVRRLASALSTSGFLADAVAQCDPGEKVIGGGGFWDQQAGDETAAADLHLVYSFPATSTATGRDRWVVTGFNDTGATRELFARAICVRSG